MDKALLFLIKLAWNSRIRLPVLIAVGFVAFDIRMQLEINIQTRRIRGRPIPRRRIDDENENVAHSRNNSESSNDSWATMEEYEVAESDEYTNDIEESIDSLTHII